jgi:hypothetical protein
MKIFGWAIIRARDLQEHKENIRLLTENIALLKEQIGLLKMIAVQKEKAQIIDLVSRDLVSKWLN